MRNGRRWSKPDAVDTRAVVVLVVGVVDGDFIFVPRQRSANRIHDVRLPVVAVAITVLCGMQQGALAELQRRRAGPLSRWFGRSRRAAAGPLALVCRCLGAGLSKRHGRCSSVHHIGDIAHGLVWLLTLAERTIGDIGGWGVCKAATPAPTTLQIQALEAMDDGGSGTAAAIFERVFPVEAEGEFEGRERRLLATFAFAGSLKRRRGRGHYDGLQDSSGRACN